MRSNFDAALAAVLKHEGGWANHPKDPGGATMKGVTLATYRRYKPGATKEQLRNISDGELKRIYRDGYWDKVRGDDLPSGLDYAVFDFAVNSGPFRSATSLQALVGAAPDGKIGPLTIKAIGVYVEKYGVPQLINELCSHRLAFLERLSTWPTFGRGWRSRVAGVRDLANQMAATKTTAPVPDTLKPGGIRPAGIIFAIVILVASAAFFFWRF